jgi:protocatechuate 3,4-dioxygenase beta subunit
MIGFQSRDRLARRQPPRGGPKTRKRRLFTPRADALEGRILTATNVTAAQVRGATARSFVDGLYIDVFKTTTVPISDRVLWFNILNKTGNYSRVAKTFLKASGATGISNAQVRNIASTALVDGLYTNILGRTADESGRASWIKALNRGASYTRVTRAFLKVAPVSNPAGAGDPTSGGTESGGGTTTTTTPNVAVTGFSVAEGNSGTTTANFVVNLSAASSSTVTINYATSDGTATAGSDYVATSGTLTFAPGVTSMNVPVTINGDTTVETDETVTLTLTGATGATIVTGSANGTITNDDSSTTGTTSTTLTPAVTEGPYFQDFSDASLNRSDVTAGQTGTPLAVTFHVYQVSGTTVTALSGARVDIWNANALGVYSDESVEGTAGQTFLRGYQATDSTGTVTFQTIIPGWYSGRTPHIHFMVRTTSSSGALTNRVTSQLFFDQTFINTLFTTTSPYSSRGLPDTTNATDMVYNTTTTSGGIAGPSLLVSLTQTSSGGYAASFNVYVAAS